MCGGGIPIRDEREIDRDGGYGFVGEDACAFAREILSAVDRPQHDLDQQKLGRATAAQLAAAMKRHSTLNA